MLKYTKGHTMRNKTLLEHIMTICEEYKQSVNIHAQMLSMYAMGGGAAKKIVEEQNKAIDLFEDEAFIAIERIKSSLNQDQRLSPEQLLRLKEIVNNHEAIKQFIEEPKE